jgi:hypothetical protein
MRTISSLPILATVPRSGTWFLRYALSFLAHLDRGGRISNRLTGRIVGDPSGARFDFSEFRGGPLFCVRGTMPAEHLFVGHTVCPGFAAMAPRHSWWHRTSFHVPGYDYLHEGLNYRYTPIELAPCRYAPLRVSALERAAHKGRGARIALVYRNPVDQAASYYWYCQSHMDATYNSIDGRSLSSVPFDDYLFDSALPSYAKQFVSYQQMSVRYPTLVRLFSYEELMRNPLHGMTAILDHLAGSPCSRPALPDAIRLARRDHLKAVERELGRSLDGTRPDCVGHMRHAFKRATDSRWATATVTRVVDALARRGVDTTLFEWPVVEQAARAA